MTTTGDGEELVPDANGFYELPLASRRGQGDSDSANDLPEQLIRFEVRR